MAIKLTTMSIVLSALLALSACASIQRPPFQKLESHEFGYRVENSVTPTEFKVTTVLPEKVDPKFAVFYASRAVAEECLNRGFSYFDIGVEGPHEVDGYCYASADHKGLGVEFGANGLELTPKRFVVSDLNGKTKTSLQKKDQILEIDGQPTTSIAQVKAIVAKAVDAGRAELDLKIKRGDDQELKIKEPIALFKNSSMGSQHLDLMRSKVP